VNVLDHGFSRVPVYDTNRQNIVGLLLLKDLGLINPAEKIGVRTMVQERGKKLTRVFPDSKLRDVLKQLVSGTQLALVHDVVNDGPGDPYYTILGIVSLEDIIQEILQDELVDESDVYCT